MKIEHVRLAAALATVIEARGGDFRPICVDLKLPPAEVLKFSQGHHDFPAGTCRKIRTYLHLKHADVMRALGDDAPAADVEAEQGSDPAPTPMTPITGAVCDEPCIICNLRPSDPVPEYQHRCGGCLRGI